MNNQGIIDNNIIYNSLEQHLYKSELFPLLKRWQFLIYSFRASSNTLGNADQNLNQIRYWLNATIG